MNTSKLELISHHLCPFLQRSIILLENKGLIQNRDFIVTRIPIYNVPQWHYQLLPRESKGSLLVLRLPNSRVLVRALTINAYLDETIEPTFLPTDAYERAVHRGLIIACGDLLDKMRMVYTAKDEPSVNFAIDGLFDALIEISESINPVILGYGNMETKMVEAAYAPLFTLMLQFDKLKHHSRWLEMENIRTYANMLIADKLVVKSKSPNYEDEFDKFFIHFGSAFRLLK